jgi:mRNA interferase RelE/StbE
MTYNVVVTSRFRRDVRKLPRAVQEVVLAALDVIARDPYQGEKMKATEVGEWKYRVGDYRIRYDIVGTDIVFLIVRHRRDVYRS